MPKLSRGFDLACVLPQSLIQLCDWRLCKQRGLHCPDMLHRRLKERVGWDWCRGSLSSGWDEQHLKTTWMLPNCLSSRSAGDHSGSRVIVRVHGLRKLYSSRTAGPPFKRSRVRSSSAHRCIEALQTLSTHTNVKIKWTRAHVETNTLTSWQN